MLFLDETTYVFDADGLILGRLASASADILLKAARDHRDDKVIIVNAEKAIVSGRPRSVLNTYHAKYELNHARKGPFFPRMPDMILKRAVRGMLPYQKKSSGRRLFATCALKSAALPTLQTICQKVTNTATSPRSARQCLSDSSAWATSAPISVLQPTAGPEVSNDGS